MTMIWNMIGITIGMVWGTFLWMVRLLLTPIVSSMVWLEWKRQGTVVEDSYNKGITDTSLTMGIALLIGGALFKLCDYIRMKNR